MVDHARYWALFETLIDAGPSGRLDAHATAASLLTQSLDPLRDRPGLEVVSLAVNGDRVDVVARDGDAEWRVVFATPDAERVDWLDVYQRPPVFAGIDGGMAIVVNGPSSSGKSTLLKAIQSRSALPWVTFDEPFLGEVRVEWLIWRERAEVLHRGFIDGIAALARAGNYVALAAGGHPQAWFDNSFSGVPVIRVGLDSDPVELARREHSRRDVPGGLAQASLDVHRGWQYHLRRDTSTEDVGAIADGVLEAVHRGAARQP